MRHSVIILGMCFHAIGSAFASDSLIPRPSYSQIQAELSSLSLEYPERVEKVVYGLSEKGRELTLVKISSRRSSLTDIHDAVLITGATHGDEYLHIEDRLPRTFAESWREFPALNQFLEYGGVIYIVPIFNPDGFEAGTRTNANHVDLNRDFPLQIKNYNAFTQKESTAFANYFTRDLTETGARLKMTVDYHCCRGALIHPWSFENGVLDPTDLARHQEVGRIMQGVFGPKYLVGPSPEIFPGSRIGTSKDFYYERLGSLSFTFEGVRRVEADHYSKHLEFWEQVFSHLTQLNSN